MGLDPQKLLRGWLAEELAAGTKKNPAFSLRALAKRLRLSSSALSEILAGKRRLSQARALELVARLGDAAAKDELLRRAFSDSEALKPLRGGASALAEELLPPKHFSLLADWRYFAVMSLLRADTVRAGAGAAAHVARRLSLPRPVAERVLARLAACGLIEVAPDGRYAVARKVFRSPDDYPQALIDKRIAAGLTNARAAMRDPERWHRAGFSTVTTDPTRLAEAERMIEAFVKQLSVFLSEGGQGSEVFELSVNLFSLTRPGRGIHQK